MENENAKPRILIFSTAYHPFVGGAEVAVKEITDRLGDFFDFDLITAKFDKKLPSFERIGNVNVYRLGRGNQSLDKIFLPLSGLIKTVKLNRQRNYFCFWGMMVTYGSGAPYLFNIFNCVFRQKKVPVVLTLQEGDSESHLKFKWFGLISLSWRMALRRTAVLTGISNFLLNRGKKYGYKGECVLVPNGVDLELFSKNVDVTVQNEIKNKLGKKESDIFLVTDGRLAYKNGIDCVIEALVRLPENISFIIIGKGKEGYKLQKQADKLGVSSRVKFLGFIDYKNLPDYLSACDIFIRPSRSEGFGNSFIEAMAAKLPVIATPVGGIVDFLDDRETGVFCSPDNPNSIVAAVNLILKDKNLKQKIVDNAYQRVYFRYGWDEIAKKMKGFFEKF